VSLPKQQRGFVGLPHMRSPLGHCLEAPDYLHRAAIPPEPLESDVSLLRGTPPSPLLVATAVMDRAVPREVSLKAGRCECSPRGVVSTDERNSFNREVTPRGKKHVRPCHGYDCFGESWEAAPVVATSCERPEGSGPEESRRPRTSCTAGANTQRHQRPGY